MTPLLGADGEVYAVAQGAGRDRRLLRRAPPARVTAGVPTAGRIATGAIVEREIGFELDQLRNVQLTLRNPDFTTAGASPRRSTAFLGAGRARRPTRRTVALDVPAAARRHRRPAHRRSSSSRSSPTSRPSVVIDEAAGVIVMGDNVRITPSRSPRATSPSASPRRRRSASPTRSAERPDRRRAAHQHQVDEETATASSASCRSGVTLRDLVHGLNALGVGPRDMISILQAIKAAGALQADIEVM